MIKQRRYADYFAERVYSATITIPGTFPVEVYFSSLTAYGIHVYDFKFKKFAMGIYYGSYDGTKELDFHHLVFLYRFMLDLKLIDTIRFQLIIPTIAAPTVVFL